MGKQPIAARWVHDVSGFVHRRVRALLAEKPMLGQAEAERVARSEAAHAYVYLPGNSQRAWDGKHAAAGSGKSDSENRTIMAAIAKRERRAARHLATEAA